MIARGKTGPEISGHEMPADYKPEENPRIRLRLYVTDWTPKAVTAFANAKAILGDRLNGNYTLEVIDVRENPRLSIDEGVLATPLLQRFFPDERQKKRQVVGTLANREKVLAGLGL